MIAAHRGRAASSRIAKQARPALPAATALAWLPSGAWLLLPAGAAHAQTSAGNGGQTPAPIPAPRKPAAGGEPQAAPPAGEGAAPASTGQQAPGPAPRGGQQDCLQMALIFVPFLLIMYFLMIRPQQKEQKRRQAMLGALKKGDMIVTSGGIHGQVAAVDEQTVTLKFGSGDGQRLKIDRSAVGRILEVKPEAKSDKDAGKNGEG